MKQIMRSLKVLFLVLLYFGPSFGRKIEVLSHYITQEKLEYPKARRDDKVVDIYHGVEVPDPYRWLENPNSNETKAFVKSQNAIAASYLNDPVLRSAIELSLIQLINYTSEYTCPTRVAGKYYFLKKVLGLIHPILYVQENLHSKERVLFNLNTESNVWTTFKKYFLSNDANFLAYFLSVYGSDWETIHIMNTKTGQKYKEVLKEVKFSFLSWSHDNLGFFYKRFPRLNSTKGFETSSINNEKVYYHKVGTPQSDDVLVIEFPENANCIVEVSHCGKWLIVSAGYSNANLVFFTELKLGEEISGKFNLTQIVHTFEAKYHYVTNDGSKAIFITNKNAPNGKVIVIDFLNFKEENWITLLPEEPSKFLNWVFPVDNDKFFASYFQNVTEVLQLHSLESGNLIQNIPLKFGTISNFCGNKERSEVFFQFTSFLSPKIIYRMDLKRNYNLEVYREKTIYNFNTSMLEVSQVFYSSTDGTRIPMFIIMKKGAVLDGSMPAFLYGYGGFSKSQFPNNLRTEIMLFILHLNGVYAIANIRGGDEYGEKWHEGGMLFNKQNSFDDFQMAAEYLIEKGYTTNKKLTIMGVSNGGLLTAACLNQRPDLFGAVISQAGVLDMLRYHKFTAGNLGITEYGSSDDAKHFANLFKYSPLHNINPPKDGGEYPATLIMSSDQDDRVVPAHSLKFIAALQNKFGQIPQQVNPLIAKISTGEGHGISPLNQADYICDILIFIIKSLGLKFVE